MLIAHVPGGTARIALYHLLLGYTFGEHCKLGYGVVIAVDSFIAGDEVVVRRGTCFVGPISVALADRTFIGRFNKIECGAGAADAGVKHMHYTRRFETGSNSLINEAHLFDVLGTIVIGRGSWVAGFSSQFLTHGASVMNRDISIGEDCFIGSAVRFAPGSSVADRVIVGMGAVVTGKILDSDVIVAGLPARVLRVRDETDNYQFEKNW
jgi:acetyltransferase-like isoleucine patch superfamily enzyme